MTQHFTSESHSMYFIPRGAKVGICFLFNTCMCWARSGGAESAGAPAGGSHVGQCGIATLCRGQLQHGLGVWDAGSGLHPVYGAGLVR